VTGRVSGPFTAALAVWASRGFRINHGISDVTTLLENQLTVSVRDGRLAQRYQQERQLERADILEKL